MPIGSDTYKRDYTLSFAYAIEEAYKKDPQGFDSLEAFAAHTIAAMIENALLRQGVNYNRLANNPDVKPAFFGCNSSAEWMLWNIESSITAHSGIDDEFCDAMAFFIDDYRAEIVKAHPEIQNDE